MTREVIDGGPAPMRVVIAGGGVAALEALLALRELAPGRVAIQLVAPEPEFVYRPLLVAEPFGIAEARRVPLADVAADTGAHVVRDALGGVEGQVARLASGRALPFDALVIAIGTRAVPALDGAIPFTGRSERNAFGDFVQRLADGTASRAAFVVPPGVSWSLPLYELALMTSARAPEAELTAITPEKHALGVFGRRVSERIEDLLADARITLMKDTVARAVKGDLIELVGGETIPTDGAVALPRLEVTSLDGVPQDAQGFIPADALGRVEGLDRVFAAGDATWFPIKQGGIATQQADAVASVIAALAGAGVVPAAPDFVLRAALLTGARAQYVRSRIGDPDGARLAGAALWWPTGKIAGRHLTGYLARRAGEDLPREPMHDLEDWFASDPDAAEAGQDEALGLALEAADAEAGWGDYEDALRWLEVAEQLAVVLPPEYVERRERWRRAGTA